MLITFATLALMTLFLSLGVAGAALIRRARGGWRVFGGALLAQGLLAAAAQIALSTVPFGIGEPLIRVPFRDIVIQTAGSVGAIGAAIGLVVLGWRWLNRKLGQGRAPRLVAAGLLIGVPLLAAGSLAGLVRASTPERERERDPNRRTIALSPGFVSNIFVQGTMDNPTTITFGPDGKLYIADISGAIWVAEDANGDGTAERLKQFASGFDLLVGLAWRDGELYTASSGKIEALRDSNGDGEADQRRLVVGNLPSLVLRPHSNNGLAFGPDGRLYFGVGSTTEGQVETNELAAAVLSVKP